MFTYLREPFTRRRIKRIANFVPVWQIPWPGYLPAPASRGGVKQTRFNPVCAVRHPNSHPLEDPDIYYMYIHGGSRTNCRISPRTERRRPEASFPSPMNHEGLSKTVLYWSYPPPRIPVANKGLGRDSLLKMSWSWWWLLLHGGYTRVL